MTLVNTHMATADLTDKSRLLPDGTVKSRTAAEFASGKGHA